MKDLFIIKFTDNIPSLNSLFTFRETSKKQREKDLEWLKRGMSSNINYCYAERIGKTRFKNIDSKEEIQIQVKNIGKLAKRKDKQKFLLEY